jgi:alpha-L-rhamnosidase
MSEDFPGVRWRGHWIVADLPEFAMSPTGFGRDLPPAEFSRVLFRRTFDLQQKPDRAPLRVSADSRYLLSVYGVEIGRGPIRSQPRRLRYDEYDVASHLVAGRNVISVLVTYYGNANSFWQPAASSGLMGRDAQLVLETRLGDEWLVTDERWRAYRSPAWRAFKGHDALTGVPVELLDARELDPSWATTDFDDSGWTAASLVKASHHGGPGRVTPARRSLWIDAAARNRFPRRRTCVTGDRRRTDCSAPQRSVRSSSRTRGGPTRCCGYADAD